MKTTARFIVYVVAAVALLPFLPAVLLAHAIAWLESRRERRELDRCPLCHGSGTYQLSTDRLLRLDRAIRLASPPSREAQVGLATTEQPVEDDSFVSTGV